MNQKILTEINTEYVFFSHLRCISLVGDENFWICGSDKITRLYNIRSELLKTTETKTGNMPEDIAVIKNNELVYTDKKEGTINVFKKPSQIQTVISLHGWKPFGVCSTFSGDVLVIIESDDKA